MRKLMMGLLGMSTSFVWAATLSQAEFDQQLAAQTKIINQSKLILEGDPTKSSVEQQKQAFCERLSAYRNIAKISRENPQLDQAYLMGVIAHRYLDRQQQSMQNTGMTEQYFCAAQKQ